MLGKITSNRWRIPVAVLAFACLGHSARAQTLTFEGLQDFEAVGNYYSGQLGGNGSGPGPNFGVSFSPSALALISVDSGGSGDFGGNPSGNTALFFLTDTAYTMDVSTGFAGTFSVFYSSPSVPGTISLYSGLDATGSLLGTLGLATTPFMGDGMHAYSPFVFASLAFTGVAKSVDFGSSANLFAYDDIAITTVPEPGLLPLASTLVLCGIGFTRRIYRSRRSRKHSPSAAV